MNTRIERLQRRLAPRAIEPDTVLGGSGEGGIGGESRLFGGLVAVQAMVAAQAHFGRWLL